MTFINCINSYRQVIESEMKDTKVDMKPIFFDALAKNSVIPEQEISVESLGRCYGPLQKQVRTDTLVFISNRILTTHSINFR